MNQTVVVASGLVALIALSSLAAWLKGPSIEQDLGSRSRSALQVEDFGDTRVSVEGRTITLAGAVPSEDDRDRAGQVVEAVWGVGAVENALTVAPPPPPTPSQPTAPKEVTNADTLSQGDCQDELNALLAEQSIRFDSYSAVIDAGSHPLLAKLARTLRRCPDTLVEIGGHTDATGPDDLNQEISQARADSVRAHLLDLKMSPDRVEAVGYGEDAPLADNKKTEGRAANRRIEFKLREMP